MTTTEHLNRHLSDAQQLLKEAKSAGQNSRREILREIREIVEFVQKEEA